MASLMESMSSMINPEMIAGLSKAFGADASAVTQGLSAAGPLLMGSMANMAGTTSGAESLMKMLPAESSGMLGGLGNIGSMISSMMSGTGGGGLMSQLMGPGVNAIGGTLSRALGFNVTPLLGMAAPALLGLVSKAVKAGNLDAAGLASMLTKENTEFADNPANEATMTLVKDAMAAGDKAKAIVASYGDSWNKVAGAPAAALLLVSSSDLSGPIGTMNEVKAAEAALLEAANSAPTSPLLGAAFGGGLQSALGLVKHLAKDHDALLGVISDASDAVAQKSPADSPTYSATIRAVAKAAAEASKEGGFFGIGGKLVSKEEQEALSRIDTALA